MINYDKGGKNMEEKETKKDPKASEEIKKKNKKT